jgi:DNA-binding protein YbaB
MAAGGMTNDDGTWNRVRAELDDAIAQGKRFDAAARRRQVVQTDQHGVVTVKANGFGEIVDLAISDQALRHPGQLGDRVTEAVVKGRRAGKAVGERLRKTHFPTIPSSDGLKAAVLDIPDTVQYDRLDYADSQQIKSAIAEYGEVLRELADDTRGFEQRYLRCEIGTAAGYVETNLADSVVRIDIHPEVARKVGLTRLSQQILTAIKSASEQASKARVSKFKKALAESPARKTWHATGEEL